MIIKQFFINELFYVTDFLRFYSGNFVSKTDPFFPGFILIGPDAGILIWIRGDWFYIDQLTPEIGMFSLIIVLRDKVPLRIKKCCSHLSVLGI